MNNKILMTYSLLSHLKETRNTEYSSLVEIFFPIVKKAIVEYANENGGANIQGKNISEIQAKLIDFFGLDIPISVLDFILTQINIEIADDSVFVYYKDKSFIINSYIFNEIDEDIDLEFANINILQDDYEKYCLANSYSANFDELIKFIFAQKIELFSDKNTTDLDFNFHIPKYISLKFTDNIIFKIITDIYLGSLISSYLEFKINTPVSKTELLVDTNFFISLIDLNTQESFSTCSHLYKMGVSLGYKFSILYSTVDQIKALLNSRIQDFANKDIGLIKEYDIFGACIRRGIDKTQLERIKDSVDSLFQKYKFDIIHETRIKNIVHDAKKSKKYKELLVVRNYHKLSALNDTIAYHYVQLRRGKNVKEFADVKCWFLNNTFHPDYYIGLGYKLHDRFKISANELLSLLWLSNPSQKNIDIRTLAKGGLATYIAKYRNYKVPSINLIKDIKSRAKTALEQGEIEEKDVYAISIRMAEGQITNGEAKELSELPDEKFITSVKTLAKHDKEILQKLDEQSETIERLNLILKNLLDDNIENKYRIALTVYEKERDNQIDIIITKQGIRMNNTAWLYIIFVIMLVILWFMNLYFLQVLSPQTNGLIAFVLFISTIFIRFVEHKSVYTCLKYTFLSQRRKLIQEETKVSLKTKYESMNKKPVISDFK